MTDDYIYENNEYFSQEPEGSHETFNSPSILSRLSAHRRATYYVLPAGLARGHRGNPAASVRVERLSGIPVLLSGLDCLVLSTQEVGVLATPESVVWFLAGCLPFEALLHLRMFSIFEMLARLNGGDNILANYARDALASAKPSSKSWFLEFQRISPRYEISPPPPNYLSPESSLQNFF